MWIWKFRESPSPAPLANSPKLRPMKLSWLLEAPRLGVPYHQHAGQTNSPLLPTRSLRKMCNLLNKI